jgi:hypothetical protein
MDTRVVPFDPTLLFVVGVMGVLVVLIGLFTQDGARPARSPRPSSQVTVNAGCELWGYNSAGEPEKARAAAPGESFRYVGRDERSAKLVDATGRELWVVVGCLP